jgi:hypothetical protein
MKPLITLIVTMFALISFAAEAQPAKHPDPSKIAEKETKKKPPSAHKPTPKKKVEEKKVILFK